MKLLDLVEYVKEHVKPVEYYSKIHGWTGGNILCPFHDDRKPSFSINIETGQGYCHAAQCGKRIGNIVHCHAEWQTREQGVEYSDLRAAREIYCELVHPLLSSLEVSNFVKELKEFPLYQKRISRELGLTLATQEQFRLGLDPANKRIIIPIPSQFGPFGFMRAYKLPKDRTDSAIPKIINKPKGSGRTDLFPWTSIKTFSGSTPVLMHKAERDTMLSAQLGFQSFCITGSGEGVSIAPWAHLFKDYAVYIIPDQDKAGADAATKRLIALQEAGVDAKICNLPPLESGKDFSDWILDNGGTVEKFQYLLDQAEARREEPIVKPKPQKLLKSEELNGHELPVGEEFETISLNKLDNIRDQKVKCNAIIIGTYEQRFRLPIKFAFHNGSDHAEVFRVPFGRELSHLIGKPDSYIAKFLREQLVKKPSGEIRISDYITARRVQLAPVLNPAEPESYDIKEAVVLGDDYQTNTPYELTILPVTEIDNQQLIALVTEHTQISNALEAPDLVELEDLNVFCPKGDTLKDYERHINKICNEISAVYTRIYERPDLHLCGLLTWLSPLQFYFRSDGIQRGWVNSLILGDTKTGKSDVARTFQAMFGCGSFISGENCTYVGLVGGAVKTAAGSFILRWGRIPINDRQLVVIEEISGLHPNEISRMSEVRSSGIARIDKGGITAETKSRTRLLCLGNPRENKAMETYPHGVDAIMQLIGQPEDISRFDLICTVADKEVDARIINQDDHDVPARPRFTAERFNKLARLVWSLNENQIEFTDDAVSRCRTGAMELGSLYSPTVPIFKASSGRILIARLACSVACLLYSFSTSEEEIRLEVNDIHVEFIIKFLQQLYNKPSFGYDRYSKAANATPIESLKGDSLWKRCAKVLNDNAEHVQLFRHLMETESALDSRLFQSISGFTSLMIFLTREGILKTDKGKFEVTAKGRQWIRSIKN